MTPEESGLAETKKPAAASFFDLLHSQPASWLLREVCLELAAECV